MHFILLGYQAKAILKRSGYKSPFPDHPEMLFPAPDGVREIATATGCMAETLDWVDGDDFNGYGCHIDPSAARLRVSPDRRADFELFAYRVSDVSFEKGIIVPLEASDEGLPLPARFQRLGYDAVQVSAGLSLGCSPLSCNGMTDGVALNAFCLVDTEDEAIELARRFSIDEPEPGPYAVVEVWREKPTSGE